MRVDKQHPSNGGPAGASRSQQVQAGRPYPLGATWQGAGVNFAIFSQHAEYVELCLFDQTGNVQQTRIEMTHRSGHIWHCFLPFGQPGLVYGYRVHGRFEPKRGQWFNPNKLLLDPYARKLVGRLKADDGTYGYVVGVDSAIAAEATDSAPLVPKGVVSDATFDWEGDRSPQVPWADMIVYELHVKGFTQQHPEVPAELRGKYLGLASEPVISYLQRLGVTTVELMPCQAFVTERLLHEAGLTDYWGYNPISFFAPSERYALQDPLAEFKLMVKRLHEAGFEVILDVVMNHTAEGSELGPTLGLRGIDNTVYYHLKPRKPGEYLNYSGCGNTVTTEHPQVLQLIMDALRYWVEEMHVDGFRFDLAPCLGRERDLFNANGKFFGALHQDPLLSRVKLIAEPWDVGHDGYQTGRFPAGWAEWNDRYRDNVRAFWRGEQRALGHLASRLAGSSDLFDTPGRSPQASINYVTCHDGFTLTDLVSYAEKHNEANLEDNRDGANENYSANYGVEGPSDDPVIRALRAKQKRNLLATLLLSQGVPMLRAGDELGKSQQGNNNAYCQDNPLSWLDWRSEEVDQDLHSFVTHLIHLRRSHGLLRKTQFLRGQASSRGARRDVMWLRPDGVELTDADWDTPFARCLGMYLSDPQPSPADTARSMLMLINASRSQVGFSVPAPVVASAWHLDFDTDLGAQPRGSGEYGAGDRYALAPRSFVLLLEPC